MFGMRLRFPPPAIEDASSRFLRPPRVTFAVAPNFRYWRALIPDASDYYAYSTKLQNLRRFFPHSDEIKFWTTMLEITKGQQDVAPGQ